MEGQQDIVQETIQESVREAFRRHLFFQKEKNLQQALGELLQPHEWEPSMRFAPAAFPITQGPSDEDVRELAGEGKEPVLDVCQKKTAAKLDLLWHSDVGPVALEFKLRNLSDWTGKLRGARLRTKQSSDAYGRSVLLDVHRLERVTRVKKGGQTWEPVRRFVLFVTNDRMYWTGDGELQESFLLTDGSTIAAEHALVYTQPSVDTRWFTYAPFRLSSSYEVRWHDVGNDVSDFKRSVLEGRNWPAARMLLIEVQPQR